MDKRTFTQNVEQCSRTLYRVAMSYTGNPADAADAVQEALVRAWSRRDTLRDDALFSTWLTRIVINECKTLLRKRRRMIPVDCVPERILPAPDADPVLFDQLMQLDEKYRVPLVLYAVEGYRLREIAAMLHLPHGTVKTRIARAKSKLEKEVLNDED